MYFVTYRDPRYSKFPKEATLQEYLLDIVKVNSGCMESKKVDNEQEEQIMKGIHVVQCM